MLFYHYFLMPTLKTLTTIMSGFFVCNIKERVTAHGKTQAHRNYSVYDDVWIYTNRANISIVTLTLAGRQRSTGVQTTLQPSLSLTNINMKLIDHLTIKHKRKMHYYTATNKHVCERYVTVVTMIVNLTNSQKHENINLEHYLVYITWQ